MEVIAFALGAGRSLAFILSCALVRFTFLIASMCDITSLSTVDDQIPVCLPPGNGCSNSAAGVDGGKLVIPSMDLSCAHVVVASALRVSALGGCAGCVP